MKKLKKRRKATTLREEVGRLLFDIGKLGLGTIVLGSILRREIPQDILMIGGITAVVVCFIVATVLVTREIKPETPETRGAPRLKRLKRRKR
jgi:uncharacterized membrane protein YraQ (UPF0718 family)